MESSIFLAAAIAAIIQGVLSVVKFAKDVRAEGGISLAALKNTNALSLATTALIIIFLAFSYYSFSAVKEEVAVLKSNLLDYRELDSKTVAVDISPYRTEEDLIPREDGMCFLFSIEGDVDRAEVENPNGSRYWRLVIRGKQGAIAKAGCIRFRRQ